MKTMSAVAVALTGLFATSSPLSAAPITTATPASAATVRASASAASSAARPNVKPGLWEITVEGERANNRQRQSSVSRSCFSAAEVAKSTALLPSLREPAMDCVNSDPNAAGPEVTWQIACTGKAATMKGSGRLHLSVEGYVGRADLLVAKAGSKPVPAPRSFRGRWIEPCA